MHQSVIDQKIQDEIIRRYKAGLPTIYLTQIFDVDENKIKEIIKDAERETDQNN